MKTYYTKEQSIKISQLSNKEFNKNSLCSRDYRILTTVNKNKVNISDFIVSKEVGKEIGSDNYMKKSKHRFLKTVNISENYLLNEARVEYCKPTNKVFPKKGDILIVKDGGGNGLGEVGYYNLDNENQYDSLSSGTIRVSLKQEKKFYILGLLKSKHFKTYIDLNTAQGSTIRHSKQISLDYGITFPSKNNNKEPVKVENLISLIVQNLIDKEEQIKSKNEIIDSKIEKELRENQKDGKIFSSTKYTKISDIKDKGRLDSDIYSEKVREIEFITENYIKGSSKISDNFKYCRGQNLQVSQIGESYYSNTPKDNFYRIFTNIEMQDNRTISGFRYIGNKNKLTTLPDNGIMLAADGMIVGRCFFYDKMENTITNIHPWVITPINDDLKVYKRVFLSLYLSHLKNIGYLAKIKDKANGGGLKKGHMDKWIKIPNFKDSKQEEIAKEYYNKVEKNIGLDFDNYLEKEKARNKELGIFQLNMEIFSLKEKLESFIDKIVMDENIDINFDY
ncbi:MAG: hypothetical protein Q9M94_02815 [Candidatus Gracilibacteria bacterium]|nr:hypothetical protein [Candidatus Gracilibacteria bacterium]MDQ7023454.1 hypothetical protein [Candidatus Gracilibacteria bacterium]